MLESGGALECNMTGRCPFLISFTTCLGEKFTFQYPSLELLITIISRKQLGKPIVLEQIVITYLAIFYQFLYTVQELRLKIDTLKTTHPV